MTARRPQFLIRNARLAGRTGADERRVDVQIAGGQIVALTPHGSNSSGGGVSGTGHLDAEVIDAEGRWLLPGLWDEHVHLSQWAMNRRRIDLSNAESAAEAAELVGRAIADDALGATGVQSIIAVNYRDANWPDKPSLAVLDAISGRRPVVCVSADLHACWLNSAALAAFSVSFAHDGVVREAEAFRVELALSSVADDTLDDWVRQAASDAAACGVVGVVDFEMHDNLSAWSRRSAAGVSLRVEASVYPQHLDAAIAAGMRTGDVVDAAGLVRMGYFKVIADGSLNTRTAWCFESYAASFGAPNIDVTELEQLIDLAVRSGITPAIHAIGDRAAAEVLDIYERLGCSGRIEHAQLLRVSDIARCAQLGVVASVQPEHAMDDRDVVDHYWPDRAERAFPFRSLDQAGVRLAFGSDAPVAPLDPWQGIAAAVFRSRDVREPWHPEQCIPFERALAASTRGRVLPRVGESADLILVDRNPALSAAAELRNTPVALTLLAGVATHRTL